jgi:hypothetical protein
MHPFIKFFLRIVLGLAFAVVITRVFKGVVSLDYVAGLTVILVGIAYVFEWVRKRK